MGRPERPIDPAAGPLQRFAYELRQLRKSAGGLSYRELARRAHYSRTALSQAAAGDELPSLAVTLAYVEACAGDQLEWEARWQALTEDLDAAAPEASDPDGSAADSPYRGLAAFQYEDADRFFGRGALVDDLVARLADAPFLAVFGASGSGKSSLLRAGLIPAVRAGKLPGGQHWPVVLLTPGEHPLAELAVQVAALQHVPSGALHAELQSDPAAFALAVRQALVSIPESAQLLLVVDQFEEIFTLCRAEQERAQFVQALLAPLSGAAPRVRLVLGIRADFYARCADHPALVDALRDAQVLVGPMTQDEMRSVITEPAAKAGLSVEPALVATMVADARGGPGTLPLLSHALLETWKRRRGDRMTLAAYQAAGGTHGAIAQTAQSVYDRLTASQKEIAQSIFLRLAALGEGTEDTRRRVRQAELSTGQDPAVELVLQRLTAARLVTLDDETAEVAHEALIREWPTLREWLAADRDGLRTHRQLTDGADAWESVGRDPGALYRGVRLAAARDWAESHEARLNELEREFLTSSEAQEQSELQAERQRNRRLRASSGILAVLLVLTAVAGGIALWQWQTVQDQRDTATARQLAAVAEGLTDRDRQLATLLSVEALNVADTPETRTGILNQLRLADQVEKFLTGHTIAANSVAVSPDGTTLASAGSDGKVILWDVAQRAARATLDGHTTAVNSVAVSPDGTTLASAGSDGKVILWDVAQRAARATLDGHTSAVNSVAVSPDGLTLATGSNDRTTILWDVTTGTTRARLAGHAEAVRSAVFSPDGRTLATGSNDRTIILWDVTTGAATATLTGHVDGLLALAFSPDGSKLASGSFGGAVIMWDVPRRAALTTLELHKDAVRTVAFSPDGRTLATGSSDRTIVLADVATGTPRATLIGHKDEVTGVAFGPDGRTVASASLDDQVVLWDVAKNPLAQHTDSVFSVAFSPDGRTIATGGKDKTVIVWDVAGRATQMRLPASNWVLDVAFSPDGRTVAAGELDGNVMLWELGQSASPVTLTGHKDWVLGVAFSPDGRILASAGYDSDDNGDGSVVLWDTVARTPLTTLTGPHISLGVTDVAFSSDGRMLAIGTKDKTVELWNVASRTPIASLAGHTGALRGVAFAPDGATLASSDKDGLVILWDVAKGTQLGTLSGHALEAYDVAFSPDGRVLASAGLDHTVILWDVAQRTRLATLFGHRNAVNTVAFSPDGRQLATGSDDETIVLWNPDVASARQRLCDIVGRELTREEWATYLGDRPQRPTCE